MRAHLAVLLACAPALAQATAAAPLRFARVFGDHMVLQRDQPLRVFGAAAPGASVAVRFGELRATAVAGADGGWLVEWPPQPAAAVGRELAAATAGAEVVLRDVVVGDVWLCSGQSNMAMGLHATGDRAALAAPVEPRLRYRPYFEHFAAAPQADLRDAAAWRVLGPDTAGGCTAVGYWFARAVLPAAGAPIGLLECAVGGTEIECWLPPAAVAQFPENAAIGARLAAAVREWQQDLAAAVPATRAWLASAEAALAAGAPLPAPPRLRPHPNEDRDRWHRTHALWNGMLVPLLRLPLRGVLWYQGENNGGEDHAYAAKLRALILTWRAAFGRELPFYYVQLPNHGPVDEAPDGGQLGFAPCRMGQLRCARLPAVGMAVTIDAGDASDLHPADKRTVGERLARFALRHEYAQDLEPAGPLFAGIERLEGALRVRFDPVGGGLLAGPPGGAAAHGELLPGFAVAGADRRWHAAAARIDGDTVVVRSAAVAAPVAVRYGYTANPRVGLWGRNGVPAAPFRSDDW